MFDERTPTLERLRDEVEHILTAMLLDIKVHDIRVRVKKKKSFLEKIERKKYSAPFEQMTDLVGARVVCSFLNDIGKVESAIGQEFAVVEKDNKLDESRPETFGYQSVHFLCKFKDGYSGPRYEGLHDLVFEIQLRTILQDAWAVVEHTLAYKGRTSTPPDLRRDFSALAGLLHVADKTFQQIQDRGEILEGEANRDVRELISETADGGLPAKVELDIDRNTLRALLQEKFPDRTDSSPRIYASLAEEMAGDGVIGISQLQEIIDEYIDRVIEDEKRFPPKDMTTREHTRYGRVGIVRRIMRERNPDYKMLPMPRPNRKQPG